MQNPGVKIICIQVIHHPETSIRLIWSLGLIMCFILEFIAREKCFIEFIYGSRKLVRSKLEAPLPAIKFRRSSRAAATSLK
jgi:hypothetical protein